MKRTALLVLSSLWIAASAEASLPSSTCSYSSELDVDWEDAFVELHGQALWPLASAGPENITSVFGPRQRFSSGQYDFHRGVDIPVPIGTPVRAPLDGQVVAYVNTTEGGYTLTLMHVMYTGWLTDWHSTTWSTFFTRYAHLNGLPTALKKAIDKGGLNGCKTIPVTKGSVIAFTGNTGNAGFAHLHYEVRAGTRYDLEDQLDGEGDTICLENMVPPAGAELDPHVNPMVLYSPASASDIAQRRATCPSGIVTTRSDVTIAYDSSGDDARLNRVYVNVYDSGGACLDEHVKDSNMRFNYDASTAAALDTQDLTHPYFDPVYFGGAAVYENYLVIPSVWLEPIPDATGGFIEVIFEDIWNERVACSFAFQF